mmetsp:Transcript_8654/g.16569  ORF Transcript_8654/g.16569 Transcript_8654/m.16569 type:complete len:476 (+) Transcript_8654:48-1475(+)
MGAAESAETRKLRKQKNDLESRMAYEKEIKQMEKELQLQVEEKRKQLLMLAKERASRRQKHLDLIMKDKTLVPDIWDWWNVDRLFDPKHHSADTSVLFALCPWDEARVSAGFEKTAKQAFVGFTSSFFERRFGVDVDLQTNNSAKFKAIYASEPYKPRTGLTCYETVEANLNGVNNSLSRLTVGAHYWGRPTTGIAAALHFQQSSADENIENIVAQGQAARNATLSLSGLQLASKTPSLADSSSSSSSNTLEDNGHATSFRADLPIPLSDQQDGSSTWWRGASAGLAMGTWQRRSQTQFGEVAGPPRFVRLEAKLNHIGVPKKTTMEVTFLQSTMVAWPWKLSFVPLEMGGKFEVTPNKEPPPYDGASAAAAAPGNASLTTSAKWHLTPNTSLHGCVRSDGQASMTASTHGRAKSLPCGFQLCVSHSQNLLSGGAGRTGIKLTVDDSISKGLNGLPQQSCSPVVQHLAHLDGACW